MIKILKPFVSLKIQSSEHFQIKSLKLWKDLNDDVQSPKSSKCRVWSFGNLTGWTQNMLKCPAWIAINSIGLKLRPEGLGIHIRASQKPFKNCFSAGRSRVYHMNSEGGWGVSSYPTNIKPSLFLGCSWVHFWIMVVVFFIAAICRCSCIHTRSGMVICGCRSRVATAICTLFHKYVPVPNPILGRWWNPVQLPWVIIVICFGFILF